MEGFEHILDGADLSTVKTRLLASFAYVVQRWLSTPNWARLSSVGMRQFDTMLQILNRTTISQHDINLFESACIVAVDEIEVLGHRDVNGHSIKELQEFWKRMRDVTAEQTLRG